MIEIDEELRPVTVRVRYPLGRSGRIVLRTDQDWEHDVPPVEVSADRQTWIYELLPETSHCYFKAVLLRDEETYWAKGGDTLAIARATRPIDVYPHFLADDGCSVCELEQLIGGNRRRTHTYRIFYPAGYHENTLRRYPVLYMQDGQNLFFPHEAFGGQHWRVAETLTILDAMNAVEPVIVVGVYPADRETDYTKPGYEAYGRFLIDRLRPTINKRFRTLTGPEHTAVMGSSLGGVVAFYLAWENPEIFGGAVCMSSTFGWRDDLVERVGRETKRPIRVYLDSGWPGDNFEPTRNMRAQLVHRGFEEGKELMYLSFPKAAHHERAWAMRAHIPFQFLFERRPRPAVAQGERSRLASDYYLG